MQRAALAARARGSGTERHTERQRDRALVRANARAREPRRPDGLRASQGVLLLACRLGRGYMSFTRGLRCPEHEQGECPCRAITQRCSLMTAAEWGLAETVRRRVAAGQPVATHCDAWGYTPLHLAAQHGHLDVVRELLRAGAAVDARACGATPLHRACYAGHLAVIEELVRAGASLHAQDTTGAGREDLPVHKAARQGHRATVDLLLGKEPALAHARNADRDSCADLLARAQALAVEPAPVSEAQPCHRGEAHARRGDEPRASKIAAELADRAVSSAVPEAAPVPELSPGAGEQQRPDARPAPVREAAAPRLGIDCPLCGHCVVRMSRLPCCGRLACRPCFLARRACEPCPLCP